MTATSAHNTPVCVQRLWVTRGPEARSRRRALELPNGINAALHSDGVALCSRSAKRPERAATHPSTGAAMNSRHGVHTMLTSPY